ncbi:putative membrane-associated kinase regulator 6-like [Dorcoceras hygrometricum]|uniref:Putative membrane-associated kinase regulator 6-like n=1 Tax=Dorcoceras hygrometricum TaxID=472368 RepID=A0A2Z7BHF8_9LAMI|nr:putative membrane-associated kinase regulator 6-like [Dorcoceras hygrometricum]
MDTTLQCPSIESFSYSWLANLNPESYLASNDDEASYYHDEAPFIEMDPRLPPSKRFIRVSSDLGFDFPVSESPLSLVHADEVISNGTLVPILIKDSKRDRLGSEECHVTTTTVPLSTQKTLHSSSRVVRVSLRRCRRLSQRWFHKYLKFLFRPFFCKRRVISEFGHMNKKWGFSAATSPRSSSVTYSADDNWRRSCDSESSIYEAVLHCKRTHGN